ESALTDRDHRSDLGIPCQWERSQRIYSAATFAERACSRRTCTVERTRLSRTCSLYRREGSGVGMEPVCGPTKQPASAAASAASDSSSASAAARGSAASCTADFSRSGVAGRKKLSRNATSTMSPPTQNTVMDALANPLSRGALSASSASLRNEV